MKEAPVASENDTPENNEDQDAMAAEWEAAMAEQSDDDDSGDDSADYDQRSDADRVPLDELTEDEEPNTNPDLDVILDIPVSISMEVGRTSISIRNLLQLNQGSVIELDRLAGEPLDVLVNGTLIAHGEVVVVNEKFGIRMTDVISPSERIKKLR
uniref:flagellar motor switch protein FliN n=2 Tax=Marinimicrobium sp. C2-29 TaxID=3139825 RepID=UPI003139F0F6